ncbi:hypothetical protein BROUX41_002776 [Berkeleyomyces rouxiae]|uniref:uncharacterized protein n=1 Tax=Berkeleyomyces rouxiae TaxID=2035830 RepID=UPI003B7DD677
MDGVLVLPPGIVVNQPGVYQEVAKFDTLPDDKIRACWHAYTVTNKKLRDPTAHRLENFWWHVWGSDRRYLSGRVLAQLYEDISTGPTAVPIHGPSVQSRIVPATLADALRHSDTNALPQLDVPFVTGQIYGPLKPVSNIPAMESVVVPALVAPTAITNQPSPSTNAVSPSGSRSVSCLSMTTKSDPDAAFDQVSPLAATTSTPTSTSAIPPRQTRARSSVLIAAGSRYAVPPQSHQETGTTPLNTAEIRDPSSNHNLTDPNSTQAQDEGSVAVQTPIRTVQPSRPQLPSSIPTLFPKTENMSSTVALLPPGDTISMSPAVMANSSLNPNTSTIISLSPVVAAAQGVNGPFIGGESPSGYAPIIHPVPSSKRPAPRQSILKKSRGPANASTSRLTARFASPDRTEKRRVNSSNVIQAQAPQSGSATRSSNSISTNPASGSSASRIPKKKPVVTAKQTKKHVVSTAVKRRPGLARRTSSNHNAVYYDSQNGSSRLPLPTNNEVVSGSQASQTSSRPPNSSVVVHNTRPSPVSTPTTHDAVKVPPLFPSPTPLAPTPEEEETEAHVVSCGKHQGEKPLVHAPPPAGYVIKNENSRSVQSLSSKMPDKRPELRPAPPIHRASTGGFSGSRRPSQITSEDLASMLRMSTPGPMVRRPSQISPIRPRNVRAQSQIDLPTASVEATRVRLERSHAIKSSSALSLGVLASNHGFPPRRRDSASTDHVPPPGSVEDTKNLPRLRRSHSTQPRAQVGMYGPEMYKPPPSFENYQLTSPSASHSVPKDNVEPEEPTTPKNNIRTRNNSTAANTSPRSQRLFASPIKRVERRGLVSPPSVATYVNEIPGTVYDFGNVDVQLNMARSQVEPLLETDYGIDPIESVRGPLDPVFTPSKPSTAPPVHLGRTRSQLALIMDRDAAARQILQAEGRSFLSGLLPWLRDRYGYHEPER